MPLMDFSLLGRRFPFLSFPSEAPRNPIAEAPGGPDDDDTQTSLARWHKLARVYERERQWDEAATCYRQLASLYREREALEALEFCYQKLERLGCADAPVLFCELAEIWSDRERFADAARAARRAIEAYLHEGRYGDAIDYARRLPYLGPEGDRERSSIHELVASTIRNFPRDLGPEPVPRPQLPRSRRRSDAPTVLMTGKLETVSLFDVVQIAQNNSVTGEFAVRCGSITGHLFFDAGRIVAARFGRVTGSEAAKHLLELKAGQFHVEMRERVPEDEFGCPNNTGLLMDLLCKIDEDRQASVAAAGD